MKPVKIQNYDAYNPEAIVKFNLSDRISEAFEKVNTTIGHLQEIRPELVSGYVEAVKLRLSVAVDSYNVESSGFSYSEKLDGLRYLRDDKALQDLILKYVCKHLQVPIDFVPKDDEEYEAFSLNNTKTYERLSYWLTKSCLDILGYDEGVQLWKKLVGLRLKDERIDYEKRMKERSEKGEEDPTTVEIAERAIKRWTRSGLGKFTWIIFDENMDLFRFDKCQTHEALKDFDDPDIAYLASCYVGDHPDYNFGNHLLRRTQTLHHGAFCDELYWDRRFHDNPEQPSLEFTENLGKDIES